jgi:hypothetical protein
MTTRQIAKDLVKKFQDANPTIRKSKEEGIASAIVGVDLVIDALKTYDDTEIGVLYWSQIKENLYNL